MLKSDFHIHTHEDRFDWWLVRHSAKDLIRLAAKQKFQVLSITNHSHVFFNKEIKDYARKKGILLIPGAEPRIEGKDVLIINVTNDELKQLKRFEDLDKIKDHALIIAPHPYFLVGHCLGKKLVEHIKQFHAIEFSHFYTKSLINPFFRFIAGNAKAMEVAKKYKKPLVGTSDAHKLYEFGTTYTLVDSAKNKDSVIEAIKHNKIKLADNPMPVHLFFRRMIGGIIKEGLLENVVIRKHIKKKRTAALQKI